MEQESWFEKTKTAIVARRVPTFDEWSEVYYHFEREKLAVPFYVGDIVNIGDEAFHERWTQVTDAFGGLDYNTVANYASVARKVPAQIRREALTFNHHACVAPLAPDRQVQAAWLQRAIDEQLNVKQLRALIRGVDEDEEDGEEVKFTKTTDPAKISDQAIKKTEKLYEHTDEDSVIALIDTAVNALKDLKEIFEAGAPEPEDEEMAREAAEA